MFDECIICEKPMLDLGLFETCLDTVCFRENQGPQIEAAYDRILDNEAYGSCHGRCFSHSGWFSDWEPIIRNHLLEQGFQEYFFESCIVLIPPNKIYAVVHLLDQQLMGDIDGRHVKELDSATGQMSFRTVGEKFWLEEQADLLKGFEIPGERMPLRRLTDALQVTDLYDPLTVNEGVFHLDASSARTFRSEYLLTGTIEFSAVLPPEVAKFVFPLVRNGRAEFVRKVREGDRKEGLI